jgi:GT2 family glycosyltransferase
MVCVVVPVFNAEDTLDTLLSALCGQTYPEERLSFFLVDNNSTDSSPSLLRSLSDPRFTILEEERRGSYAARNRALRHIEMEWSDRCAIVAFTDSDCHPEPEWVKEGVACLQRQAADLVSGLVAFDLHDASPSAWGWFDVVNHLKNDALVDRGTAVTANLFVRWPTLLSVGRFDSALRSGGDFVWTYQATQQGHSLAYCPTATVWHPVRSSCREVLRKAYRTGYGQSQIHSRYDGLLPAPHRLWKQYFPPTPWRSLKPFNRFSPSICQCIRMYSVIAMTRYARIVGSLAGRSIGRAGATEDR